MLTIAAACPRCLEPHTILRLVHASGRTSDLRPVKRESVAICTHCHQFVLVVLEAPGAVELVGNRDLEGDIRNYRERGFSVRRILPDMPATAAPEHVPDPVAKAYVDGLRILQAKMWTAAAGSFRTALDRATKVLWLQTKGDEKWPRELSPRIEQLRVSLDLPKSVADWAHQVRIVGNELHDIDEVEEEDARDAGNFAELFLTYTFTLPMRLEEFRARRAGS